MWGQARRMGSSCSKDLNSPLAFRPFKDSVRERVAEYVISLCSVLWLVDGDITG